MELKFFLQEECDRSWRYGDPFVGEIWLRKVDLPNPPPPFVILPVEYEVDAS